MRRRLLPHPTTIRRPGENLPPVDVAPEYPDAVPYDDEQTGCPINWRKVIEGAGLKGPIRNLAAQAEPLELTPNHVKLRLKVAAFASESSRQLLSQALSRYFNTHCMVEFEIGELQSETLGQAEERERQEARRALIEGFRNDPFVKQVLALFHGTIEESTVRPRQG